VAAVPGDVSPTPLKKMTKMHTKFQTRNPVKKRLLGRPSCGYEENSEIDI
jgi:hypothetical protein